MDDANVFAILCPADSGNRTRDDFQRLNRGRYHPARSLSLRSGNSTPPWDPFQDDADDVSDYLELTFDRPLHSPA